MPLHIATTDKPSKYYINQEWDNQGAARRWIPCYLHYMSNIIVNFYTKTYPLYQRITDRMC